MSLCSVIIVARQSGAVFFAGLESVFRQKNLGEIIIVDNGNAPDVISRLQQKKLSEPRLKIITVRGDVDFAKGCNIGAKQASCEFLLLLKSGYLLSPDAISELCGALDKVKKIMLSGGIVQCYDGNQKSIARSQIITPTSIFKEAAGVKPQRAQIPGDASAFETATIASACMCVRASDYKKAGGLDGELYSQEEEFDFCLRLQQIGGRVFCVPSVKITRLPNRGDNKLSIARQFRETKNLIHYLDKFFAGHQPFGTLFLLNILIVSQMMAKILICGLFEYFGEGRQRPNDVGAKRLMILAMGAVDLPESNELSRKIVLVTGATSDIGLCVIRRLLAAGSAVLALSRGGEIPYYHSRLRWIKKDLTDHDFNLDDYLADAVIHCAPLPHLPPLLETLEKSEAKRVVAFGSTEIFSNLLAARDFEKDKVLKLQNAEKLLDGKCAALGVRYTIFRPTQIYGMGMDKDITPFARIIRRLGVMFVYPPAFGRRQPVHVDDLAAAAVAVINNENTFDKSYNLSGGEIVTFRDMLTKIFVVYNKKPRIISATILPFALDVAGKILRKKEICGEVARRMNEDSVFFHDDATRDFGFKPRSFLSGGIKDIEGF